MTRLEAMRIAIAEMEKQRRLCSDDLHGLIPLEGFEADYYHWDSVIKELKEVCQALQAEDVKRSIAAWQMDIMSGKEPDTNDLLPAEERGNGQLRGTDAEVQTVQEGVRRSASEHMGL